MMNNNRFNESEFENMLRDKIDELASGVDCFDKISSRAFHEEKKDYSESGYTICDLENVTGKKRGFRFFPTAVTAVAAIVCIAVLPKTGFVDSFFARFSDSGKKVYIDLINEINEETQNGDYSYFDCTLDEYIRNDLFITPLHQCPFEESGNDDINVRIFVKMCGDIATNQIYAVQYEGEYSDANYIAAAASKAELTDEETDTALKSGLFPDVRDNALEFVEKNYGNERYNRLVDENYSCVYVSSLPYNCIYKYDDTVYLLSSELVITTGDEESGKLSYNYLSVYYDENMTETAFDTSVFSDSWDDVVYFSGSSAKAEVNASDFSENIITPDKTPDSTASGNVSFVENIASERTAGDELFLYRGDGYYEYAQIPFNPQLCSGLRVYSRYTDGKFAVRNVKTENILSLKYDTPCYNYENSNGNLEFKENIALMEHINSQLEELQKQQHLQESEAENEKLMHETEMLQERLNEIEAMMNASEK